MAALVRRWAVRVGRYAAGSPVTADGMVYVEAGDTTFDGRIVSLFRALDAGTGAPRWSLSKTAPLRLAPGNFRASVHQGILYLMNNVEGGRLEARVPADGRLLWANDYGFGEEPAVRNGLVYAHVTTADFRSGFAAFDQRTGAVRFVSRDCCAKTGLLAVDDTTVLAHRGEFLEAFDAAGVRNCGAGAPSVCTPLWSAVTDAFTGGAFTTPAIANGIVYLVSRESMLYAFRAGGCGAPTCAPLWTAPIASEGGFSSPAVANGVVYVGSHDSKLYAFDANGCGAPTCTPLWTAATGGSIFSSPAVANGVVYVGSVDSKLYAFAAAGCGKQACPPLWSAATGGAVYASPAVSNGTVYVGSFDGKLYAYGLP